ncbi:hypothetical protein ACFL4W_04525 [Planctomycetota bacterium]
MAVAGTAAATEMAHEFFFGGSLNFESDINTDPVFIEFKTKEEDMRIEGLADYTLDIELSENDSAGVLASLAMNMFFEENSFSNNMLRVGGYYKRDNMGPLTFYVDAYLAKYMYAGDVEMDEFMNSSAPVKVDMNSDHLSINPTLFWRMSDVHTGVIRAKIRTMTYSDDLDFLDGLDWGLGYKHIWQIDPKMRGGAGLSLNQANLDEGEWSYSGYRLDIDFSFQIDKMWRVYAAAAFGNKNFDDDFPGEGDPRKESYMYLAGGVEADLGTVGKAFVGLASTTYTSNVDYFDVNRMVVSGGYMYTLNF